MMGTPQNSRSDVFWNADIDEAARILEAIILEIKPHVLITYDEEWRLWPPRSHTSPPSCDAGC